MTRELLKYIVTDAWNARHAASTLTLFPLTKRYTIMLAENQQDVQPVEQGKPRQMTRAEALKKWEEYVEK